MANSMVKENMRPLLNCFQDNMLSLEGHIFFFFFFEGLLKSFMFFEVLKVVRNNDGNLKVL